MTARPAATGWRLGQRGGFVLGVVVGLLVGLSIALGVALYITKAPVPFVNKVPQRTAEQDQAEQQRNKNWDPNAPLAGKPAKGATSGASGASGGMGAASGATAGGPTEDAPAARPATGASAATAAASSGKAARDPAAILAGSATPGGASSAAAAPARPGVDPFVYFVQAGAYARAEEAEQQRARLAMLGHAAKVTEREQSGRVVYRVRMGPFDGRAEADALQLKLQEATVEAQIVRVERP